MNNDDKYISPKEAAAFMGVCYDTMDRWIRRGEIPAIKIGHLWFIPRNFIELKKKGKNI